MGCILSSRAIRCVDIVQIGIGLDLGTFETRIAVPKDTDDSRLQLFSVPTLVGYTQLDDHEETISCIGKPALMRRDRTRLCSPFGDTSGV